MNSPEKIIRPEDRIAELKRELGETQRRFDGLLRLSSDWYWVQDTEFRFINVSNAFSDKVGPRDKENLGMRRWELPDTLLSDEEWAAHIADCKAHRPFRDFEYKRRMRDGDIYHLSITGEPTFDENGVFTGYHGIGSDITTSKKAEAALLESETRFRTLLELVPDSIVVYVGGKASFVNAAAVALFRAKSRDQILGKNIVDFVLSEDYVKAQALREALIRDGTTPMQELRLRGLDGSLVYAEVIGKQVLLDGKPANVTIGRDITQRKLDGALLARSEARFHALTDLSADWYWEQDVNFCFTQIVGGPYTDIESTELYLGKPRWELPHVFDPPEYWQTHIADLKAHRAFRGFEYRVLNDDGKIDYMSISGGPIFNAEGHFDGYRGVGHDVTQKKQAELALQESQERYHLLFGLVPDAIIVFVDGRVVLANPSAVFLFRADSATDMIGKLSYELVPQDSARIVAGLREVIDNKSSIPLAEMRLQAFDGSLIDAEVVGERITFDGNIAMVIVARDITAQKTAEKALHLNEEVFRQLTELSADWYWEQDAEFRFTSVSGSAHKQSGLHVGSYIGKFHWDFHWVNVPPEFWDKHRALLAAHTPYYNIELQRHNDDGKVIWTSISGEPFYDESGIFAGYRGMSQDITARKNTELVLRTSEERYRKLVDISPASIIVHDGNTIQFANPAAMGLLHANSLAHLQTRLVSQFIHPEDLPIAKEHKQLIEKFGQTPLTPVRYIAMDNSVIDVEAIASRIEFDGIPMFQIVSRDITRHKRAEEALLKLNMELEQRVAERTAELTTSNEELESFSYSISHDLRAPLRAIEGFARILREDYDAHFDDEGRRYLQKITASSQRMARLIEDLLKLAQLTRTEIHRQPVDLSKLCKRIFADLAVTEPGRHVETIIGSNLVAAADRGMVQVVLENLLGNAWKFTRKQPQGRIEVGLWESPSTDKANAGESKGTVFFVRDNGAGFDPTYATRLFEPFLRLHPESEFEGNGIGLASVRKIIKRHGGNIWAVGRPGEGATLFFSLD